MHDMEFETAVMNAIAELPPQRQKIFKPEPGKGLKYRKMLTLWGLHKTIDSTNGKSI